MAAMALVFVAASAHAKAGAVCKSNNKGDEAGGSARATATNGGTAQAFDDAPPLCSPGPPPGTATVKSSGGNC